MNLENKKVLVFGSGISGIGAADLLVQVGAKPVIYDENLQKTADEILAKVEQPEKVQVYIGKISEEEI